MAELRASRTSPIGSPRLIGLATIVAIGCAVALTSTAFGRDSDKVQLRTISVQPCNGEVQGFRYRYKGPRTTRALLSATDASQLVSFNDVLLAPRGWHCDLVGGSGGDTLTAYNPAAGFFLSSSTVGYLPQEAITDYFATTGNHAQFQACSFFDLAAEALKKEGLSCDSVPYQPFHERRTQVSLDEIDFSDPPRISEGTGYPSGGRNWAVGLELFDVRYDASNNDIDNAATATCTVSAKHEHLCPAVLRDVRRQFNRYLKQ